MPTRPSSSARDPPPDQLAGLVADEHGLGTNLERLLKSAGHGPGVLFDQALLSEGGKLEDPAGFVHRLNEMFLVVAGGAASAPHEAKETQ